MTATRVTSQDIKDGTITDADVATANKDGTTGTPSLRTLGTGAQQAAAGTAPAAAVTAHEAAGDPHPTYTTAAESATVAGSAITTHEAAGDPHPGYLTPTEHTAIGDSAPHHAAVTLAADADTLLGLTGQQVTLDVQNANKVFVGPASGGDADPTFRVLVDADIPAAIARDSEVTSAISTHEAAGDPHPTYLTAAEHTALGNATPHMPNAADVWVQMAGA